jgi:hypothetical protein
MSIAVMILGESGTGKTSSLRHLDPSNTLLIQTISKPLPFRASAWKPANQQNPQGSILVTDKANIICKAMHRTQKDVIVLDDFQYVMANEFMRRSDERGFDKFTDIGRHAWDILNTASQLAAYKRVYILAHTQTDDTGKVKAKTIGKLLDEKITIEGMFSIVLRTAVVNGQYLFCTQNSGSDTTKSPIGLFDDFHIENDLAAVDAAIFGYYGLQEPVAA